MINVFKSISSFREFRKTDFFNKSSVGLVPTMGALHRGHIELIRSSISKNDITVVTIFINPTQFNNSADLKNYPVVFHEDLAKLKRLNVDILLCPDYNEIYSDSYNFRVKEQKFSRKFCGKFRPGHFDGVLTVVMRLFNIVKPTRAYFGEKDFQQLTLIEGMVKAFFMDIEIVSIPTIRSKNGLALSSRNKKLTTKQLEKANQFPKILASGTSISNIKKLLLHQGFRVEYVSRFNNRILAAVYLGKVRLIDNVKV